MFSPSQGRPPHYSSPHRCGEGLVRRTQGWAGGNAMCQKLAHGHRPMDSLPGVWTPVLSPMLPQKGFLFLCQAWRPIASQPGSHLLSLPHSPESSTSITSNPPSHHHFVPTLPWPLRDALCSWDHTQGTGTMDDRLSSFAFLL